MEVIEQILKSSTIPQRSAPKGFRPSSKIVLWVLGDRGRTYSLIETLKSLVFQALCFKFTADNFSPTEVSFHVTKFRDAFFEEDYLRMLGSLLQDFRLVCMLQFSLTIFLPTSSFWESQVRKGKSAFNY